MAYRGGVRFRSLIRATPTLLGNSVSHPGRSGGMAGWYRTPGIPSVAKMKQLAVARSAAWCGGAPRARCAPLTGRLNSLRGGRPAGTMLGDQGLRHGARMIRSTTLRSPIDVSLGCTSGREAETVRQS